MPPGSKPGERRGGRQKGTRAKSATKITPRAVCDILEALEFEPIAEMVQLYKKAGHMDDIKTQAVIIKEIASYFAPKLSAVRHEADKSLTRPVVKVNYMGINHGSSSGA